jgi:PPOX class probable F420-dependent enzyme
MDLERALSFARPLHQGVLVTLRRDGRPQLSNIMYLLDDERTARISVTAERAKVKNLSRDPRASLYVVAESFWQYLVLDGSAELSPVAAAADDAVADELVEIYRALGGEHPDWGEYRRAMVDDRRLVIRLRVERAYGMLPDAG